MNLKGKMSFSMIACIIGFMIAVSFQTEQDSDIRMTKDIWEIREALSNEMKLQSRLLEEIRLNEKRINDYETEKKSSKEEALKQTLYQLQDEAGLTVATGPGITLTVDTFNKSLIMGKDYQFVSPTALSRLVNELNMYGAKHISIDGERLINTTVIREINGETKVNTHSLHHYPFQINVITETKEVAEKMYNRMMVSPVLDDFFIDNLKISISNPQEDITVPAYVDPIQIQHMKPVRQGDG